MYAARVLISWVISMGLITERAELQNEIIVLQNIPNPILLQEILNFLRPHFVKLRSKDLIVVMRIVELYI